MLLLKFYHIKLIYVLKNSVYYVYKTFKLMKVTGGMSIKKKLILTAERIVNYYSVFIGYKKLI